MEKLWRSSRSKVLRFESWLAFVFVQAEDVIVILGCDAAKSHGSACLMQFVHDGFSSPH